VEGKTWAEQWVSSPGYAKAMDVAQRRHAEFWEAHHERMADLDRQQEALDDAITMIPAILLVVALGWLLLSWLGL
jgi:hypothetical protein